MIQYHDQKQFKEESLYWLPLQEGSIQHGQGQPGTQEQELVASHLSFTHRCGMGDVRKWDEAVSSS